MLNQSMNHYANVSTAHEPAKASYSRRRALGQLLAGSVLLASMFLIRHVAAQDEDLDFYVHEERGREIADLVIVCGIPKYKMECNDLHRHSIEELFRKLSRCSKDGPIVNTALGQSRMVRRFKVDYATQLDVAGGESPWEEAWSVDATLYDAFYILSENTLGLELGDGWADIETNFSTTKMVMELAVYIDWDPETKTLWVWFHDLAHDFPGPLLDIEGSYNIKGVKTLTTYSKFNDFNLSYGYTPKTASNPEQHKVGAGFSSTTNAGKRRLVVTTDGPICHASFGLFSARETVRTDNSTKIEFEFDSTWASNYRMTWVRSIVDDFVNCASTKALKTSLELNLKGEITYHEESSCSATTSANTCDVTFSASSTWFADTPESLGMLNRTCFVTEIDNLGRGKSYVQNKFYDDQIWLFTAASPAGGINAQKKTLGPMGWSRKAKVYVREFSVN